MYWFSVAEGIPNAFMDNSLIIPNIHRGTEIALWHMQLGAGLPSYSSKCCFPHLHPSSPPHPPPRQTAALNHSTLSHSKELHLLATGLWKHPHGNHLSGSCQAKEHLGCIPLAPRAGALIEEGWRESLWPKELNRLSNKVEGGGERFLVPDLFPKQARSLPHFPRANLDFPFLCGRTSS